MRFGEDYRFYLEVLLSGASWRTCQDANYVYVVRRSSLTGQHGMNDLEKFCAADSAILEHPRMKADPELRRVLVEHLVSSQQRLNWVVFTNAIKSGDPLKAVHAATFSPAVLRYVVANCIQNIAWRVSRRFKTLDEPLRPQKGG
jgi:hypothetical protein